MCSHNTCFRAKNNVYLFKPQFYYIRSYKHGFLGVLDYMGALI